MTLRIGISISGAWSDAPQLLDVIKEADAIGVTQLWMTQGPDVVDALSLYAAALTHTKQIRLGTSIVPSYPRHPLELARQAATVVAFGPGRLRLGIGTSHRPTIEGTYGIPMEAPLEHLREYVEIMRAA